MSYGQYMAWRKDKCLDKPKPLISQKEIVGIKIGECVICGKDIIRHDKRGLPNTCSKECREEKNRRKSRARYMPGGRRMFQCPECGKEFMGTGHRKYCSSPCRKEANKRQTMIRHYGMVPEITDKTCPMCKKVFTPDTRKRIFCGINCQREYNRIYGSFKERSNGKKTMGE
jgi:endogenous inhibitor of DNA gyrase (YacG/DUF329 family)